MFGVGVILYLVVVGAVTGILIWTDRDHTAKPMELKPPRGVPVPKRMTVDLDDEV